MKKKTNDDSSRSNLPPDIIAHLLSLLPVKSLCRFKSVSPSWNSLISSPQFAKTQLHMTNKPQKTILISTVHVFYSVDFADENPAVKELDFSSVERSSHFSGSCNGLVLVRGFSWSLFLLNPTTSECKQLPESPFRGLVAPLDSDYVWLPGFGYDSYTDDYKVVMLYYNGFKSYPINDWVRDASITNVAVYSLKTDAWRIIQDTHYIPVDSHAPGVHFNERVHWLCRRTGGLRGCVVVAFNFSDEVFREMQWPAFVDDHEFLLPQMAVLGGCLSLIACQSSEQVNEQVEVWVMKMYGVRESWTKFTIANHGMSIVDVVYLSAKEEFVFQTNAGQILDERHEHKLVVYNLRKETLRDMVVSGIPTQFLVVGKYIETLVSPNHGGWIRRQREASSGESSQSY